MGGLRPQFLVVFGNGVVAFLPLGLASPQLVFRSGVYKALVGFCAV